MRELFDITPHPTGSGFRMRLKTGEIDVPDGCGGYIISSGMGSGKTESIKSLIRQKYDEGILYCVDTRDELKKMYRWIIEELVSVPATRHPMRPSVSSYRGISVHMAECVSLPASSISRTGL